MTEHHDYRRFAGKTLHGPEGRIGKIVDVYESTDGSGLTFATVATGLFGTGASFFPLHEATEHGDEVHVPYTKDFIKDAPRVDNDEELSAPEEARLFQYYRPMDLTAEAMEHPAPDVELATGADLAPPSAPRLRRHVPLRTDGSPEVFDADTVYPDAQGAIQASRTSAP